MSEALWRLKGWIRVSRTRRSQPARLFRASEDTIYPPILLSPLSEISLLVDQISNIRNLIWRVERLGSY